MPIHLYTQSPKRDESEGAFAVDYDEEYNDDDYYYNDNDQVEGTGKTNISSVLQEELLPEKPPNWER